MGSEFIRVKAILDQIPQTEEETRVIADVSRIKAILDNNSRYKSQGFLCDLLSKLKQPVVSMKVLEVTMIGATVSRLLHHASKDVRHTARTLVRTWRLIVDEWMAANGNNIMPVCPQGGRPPVVPTSKQQTGRPPLVPIRKINNITTEIPKPKRAHKLEVIKRKMINQKRLTMAVEHHKNTTVETRKMQKPTEPVVPPFMSSDNKTVEDQKFQAAKRKFEESYKEFENRKRQRRVQVIEMHDMMRLGLAPKHEGGSRRRFGQNISRCVGLVR